MRMNNTVSEIKERLLAAKNTLVFCHARPDGDAIGSAFALRALLVRLGGKADVMCADPVPARLTLLCPGLRTYSVPPFEPDTVITVDVASPSQLGTLEKWAEMADIKIDHHDISPDFGKMRMVCPEAAAAGEIVFDIAKECDVLDIEIADCIYGAIASDTGSFKYSNVTKRTFETAAELVRIGARTAFISEALFEKKPLSEAVVCGVVYSDMKSACGGRLRYVIITNEKKEKYGFCDEDLGNASSLLREISGVSLAVAIKQDSKDPEKFRLSMRSGEEVNCAELCAEFGGGGHIRAAGCTLTAQSPQEAEEKMLAVCKKVFE